MGGARDRSKLWLALGAVALVVVLPAVSAAAGSAKIVTKTFRLAKPNKAVRHEVKCRGGRSPLGGGIIARPPVGSNGEGAYPTSSERLGVQHGWHIGAVLLDRTPKKTQARKIKLQVSCGPHLGQINAVHRLVHVRSGRTRKAVAKCPGKSKLVGGGFLTSLMTNKKGDYTTASRQGRGQSWAVSAHAFGGAKSASVTAVAYCIKSKHSRLREVSRGTTLSKGVGSVATPRCPGKRKLVLGGFNGPGSGSVRFFNTHFTGKGTWSVSGYSSKASQRIRAFGYCL